MTTWFASTTSINSGNNTGWSFTDAATDSLIGKVLTTVQQPLSANISIELSGAYTTATLNSIELNEVVEDIALSSQILTSTIGTITFEISSILTGISSTLSASSQLETIVGMPLTGKEIITRNGVMSPSMTVNRSLDSQQSITNYGLFDTRITVGTSGHQFNTESGIIIASDVIKFWSVESNYSLGTFYERELISLQLPVVKFEGITYTLIAGELPPGIRLKDSMLVGTPYEVPRLTTFKFCIRASIFSVISDRTFTITIDGADAPTFTTASGFLDIGLYHQLFVLDSTYVDYQIEAYDNDTATGQKLSYFIADNEGVLPPGLTLTTDGRLVGFVEPTLSIKPEDGTGWYDNGVYDIIAYDFGYRPTNGYDSYIFDIPNYDYSLPSSTPKKLNRNYEFTVTITDGDSIAKRTFKIFVVGDDYFRADNNTLLDNTGLFTADVTYLRSPIWVTKSDLGTFRANNYIVIFLDTYNRINGTPVSYTFVDAHASWIPLHVYTVNDLILINGKQFICIKNHISGETIDITSWASYGLPPGMKFDYNTADIYGRVPYQPAITETYRFTITATTFDDSGEEDASATRTFTLKLIGEIDSVLTWITPTNLGSINANCISTLKVEASSNVTNAIVLYTIEDGSLPNGLSLTLDGEIVGTVTQFTNDINLKGLTNFDHTKLDTVFDGGATTFDRSLINNVNLKGLTIFDYIKNDTLFDGGTTTYDRISTVTIKARDIYAFSEISRTFTIFVDTPYQINYSNIKVKPLLKMSQRDSWKLFINDTSIFTPNSIYRLNDTNFGVQTDLSMMIYAGIESKDTETYISAMGLNHKRKRFQFGTIKKATAIDTVTKNKVYEVVYIEMIDPLEPNNKRLPNKISGGQETPDITTDNSLSFWDMTLDQLNSTDPDSTRPNYIISADSTGYQSSNSNPTIYYPNSVSNWRDRLKNWSDIDPFDPSKTISFASERNYLPLWMRSIQPGTKTELGFTLAVPLCYCKIGMGDDIMLNIKHSNFDFKLLDYTVDRYIIDSVDGSKNDKYLIFRNDRITI